jgi:AraC-like DNA-binding protein
MHNMIFPLITNFDAKLPIYLNGLGFRHIQEDVSRPNGIPYYQWIQCRHGKGVLIVGGYTYDVCENQGMLIFADIPHEYYAIEPPWEVDWISIGGYGGESFFRNSGIIKSGVYTVTHPEILLSKTERMLKLTGPDTTLKTSEYSVLLYSLMIDLLLYTYSKNDNSVQQQYLKLKPVFDYIAINYNIIISLSELAQIASITPEHLCNIFKSITGVRVFEYINNVRIKNSKELLLKRSDMQIKQIALECGFTDVSYFCSVFKKLEKISPGEFRKLHGIL